MSAMAAQPSEDDPELEGERPWVRLGVLGGLYLVQGIVWGFAGFVLLPSLAARGVSLQAQTGILALAGLPWVLKLGWAAWVDHAARRGHSPRRHASLAMATMAVLLAIMALGDMPSTDVTTLGWLWLLLNVALALQDVATDALALDRLRPEERGRANGVMLAGHHLGFEGIGGLALGLVVAAYDLRVALGVAAALMALGVPLPWAMKASPRPERRSNVGIAPALRAAVSPRALPVAVVAITALAADHALSGVYSQFVIGHLEWTQTEISQWLVPAALVSNVLAYLGAAAVADRWGHRRVALVGSVGLGLVWLAFSGLEAFWWGRAFMAGFVVVQSLVTALLYVGLHAAFMDHAQPRIRASHFAVLMGLYNLPRVYGPPLGAALFPATGWSGLFIVAGVYQACFVSVAIAWGLRQRTSRELQDTRGS